MPDGAALVVGLGNPGPEYERTRHNVGFRVLDLLAERLGANLRPLKGVRALSAEARDGDHRVILGKPTTYMNESGEAVGPLARYYKVEPAAVVVVHDEIDLPLGTIRVKLGGSDAGHNGLRSVTRALGSGYARVRVGVGRPKGRSQVVDHVLRGFSKEEEKELPALVDAAADAVAAIVRDGVEAAQQRYHASPAGEPPPERVIRKAVTVAAPREQVWHAWTTVEGATTFFAPQARIELTRGGAYELLFDLEAPEGSQGSEGCKVLAFREPRFLVFSWNAPPHIPEVRKHRTRVQVTFDPDGEGTKVSLEHRGWRSGADWDEAFAYFDRAWGVVLERLQLRFSEGPKEW